MIQYIQNIIFSIPVIFTAVTLLLVYNAIVLTPGKRAKIIERLGKPLDNARMPGLSFKIPFIDDVVGVVNLQLREISSDVRVKTLDNAFMTLPVKVQYVVSEDAHGPVRAHYELEDAREQITSYVLNIIRQKASTMAMVDLYSNRDGIQDDVSQSLGNQFKQYGFVIKNVLVDEPQPSPEVRAAFNRVIASEREKEAATNLAEAKRIELVGVAKAEKESKKLQGEGIADMRDAIAKGLNESIEKLSTHMSVEQAIALIMDTNRLDTMNSVSTHGNLILADLQSGVGSGFVQTVAGMAAVNLNNDKDNKSDSSVEDVSDFDSNEESDIDARHVELHNDNLGGVSEETNVMSLVEEGSANAS